MCADKGRDVIGKVCPGGEQEGKGTQEDRLAMVMARLMPRNTMVFW